MQKLSIIFWEKSEHLNILLEFGLQIDIELLSFL